MLSSKSRSGLSDAVNKNAPPSKIGRVGSIKLEADSPSPQKTSSFSNDVSPRSADSKSVASRRKNSTTPDKPSRPLKGSELQSQIAAAQEELVKAKEQLSFEEKEKERLLQELSEAKKAVEEVTEKLAETLLTQRKAEENSELEKFRADELEQSAIEAAQKREKEWNKVLEDIQNQRTHDAASLLSATEELQKAIDQVKIVTDEKNRALIDADNATKIAEINAEKAEVLSGEINHLQSLLDSKLEAKSDETGKLITQLSSEVEGLKQELSKAQLAAEKLMEVEDLVERLKLDLSSMKMAESEAVQLADYWRKEAELLESYLEDAKQSERMARDSLASLTKQLDETTNLLEDADSQIISLRGKAEALELEVARHKADYEKSDTQLNLAKQEALDQEKAIEALKSEIVSLNDEKAKAVNDSKIASSNMETLSEQNRKLAVELEVAKKESNQAKNALDDLASALHEVSAEARDGKERLSIKQAEVDDATASLDALKWALKEAEQKYGAAIDEANNEVLCLKKAIDKAGTESKELRDEWSVKETTLRKTIKAKEDEIVSIMMERDKALETVEIKVSEAKAAEEEIMKLADDLRGAQSKLVAANDSFAEAKEESGRLKERLLDKENELQSITQENEDLRIRDTAASERIKELLESQAKMSSNMEENGLHISDTIPKTIEAVEDEKVYDTESRNSEPPPEEAQGALKVETQQDESVSDNSEEWNRLRMKLTNSEGETIDKLPCESDHYAESLEDELESKNDENKLNRNGSTSPAKKKKALLHKFSNLLKKKNIAK